MGETYRPALQRLATTDRRSLTRNASARSVTPLLPEASHTRIACRECYEIGVEPEMNNLADPAESHHRKLPNQRLAQRPNAQENRESENPCTAR